MMAKARAKSQLALPWERPAGRLLGVLTGSRLRLMTAAAALLGASILLVLVGVRHVRMRTTRLAIDEVHRAITAFRRDHERCPWNAAELLRPPSSGTRYLRALPADGWGRTLYIRCPGRFDPDLPDVVSAGPSGSFFTDDNMR